MKSESASAEASFSTGKQVLAVEDDARVRKMLAHALKEMAFNATFAPSAETALRIISEQAFDIVILDLNLPGMGGIDFLESIRRQQNDIQVIVLSGFGDLDAARKAIHFDVVEFLTKPCALGDLEAALSKARDRRKGQIVSESSHAAAAAFADETPRSRAPITSPPEAGDDSMESIEQRHILSVLQKNNGNRAATAAELGISVRKLYYRLGEYQRRGLLISCFKVEADDV